MQDKCFAGQEGYRTGGIQDRVRLKTGGIQDRWDTESVRFRTGEIQDRWDTK